TEDPPTFKSHNHQITKSQNPECTRLPASASSVSLLFHLAACVHDAGDLVAGFPELLVEDVLLALAEDVHGAPGCAQHVSADDAMRQLHVMEAEELHSFVEVEQLLCDF